MSETARSVWDEPPWRLEIDLTMSPSTGDDEDFVASSGSGAGPVITDGSGDSTLRYGRTTRTYSGSTITVSHAAGGAATTGIPDQGHHHDHGVPHLWMIVGVVSVISLFLLAVLAFCLVRRKRKAVMAQRSARWDRASGANIAATRNLEKRSNPSTTKATSLKGYYLGAPIGPPPDCPQPPIPVEGMSTPSSPPAYLDPRSPTQLLQYDSLNQDGCYDHPGTGYAEPNGHNEYKHV